MSEAATAASTSETAAEAAATTQDPPTTEQATQSGAHTLVRGAISAIKQHPLGAVATVAAAAAFIEVELAVGLLAGIGATALLANESGPEARHRVLEQGKRALSRARTVLSKPKTQPQIAPPV
jgi:hypothetical protein